MIYEGAYADSDEEWSKSVKTRYHNQCTWPCCSSRFGLGAHHVVPRRSSDLRLYIDNGVLLCAKHHEVVESCKNTLKYDMLMRLLIGTTRYDTLWHMHTQAKLTLAEPVRVPDVSSEVEF